MIRLASLRAPLHMAALATVLAACAPGRAQPPATLPGTEPLQGSDPLDVRMRQGADALLHRKIRQAMAQHLDAWSRDVRSAAAYTASIRPQRQRLRTILGAGNRQRHPHTHLALPPPDVPVRMERIGDDRLPALLYDGDDCRIFRVRWPVLPGVHGEGLLLLPHQSPKADVVVIPDADQLPEHLAGLLGSVPAPRQLARRLAASGVRVVVPVLISRQDVDGGGPIEQSHREWIYRQAFHMGRHVLGYEIDKIQAAMDWITETRDAPRPLGLAGWGEGALLALYTAALDPRADVTLVSEDWGRRAESWREPIYRNVWGLMNLFDDADVASLVAPRRLIVERSEGPPIDSRRDKARRLAVSRAWSLIEAADKRILGAQPPGAQGRPDWLPADWITIGPDSGRLAEPFAEPTLEAFARSLGVALAGPADPRPPALPVREPLEALAAERQQRQLAELDDYTQYLARAAERVRDAFFLQRVLPEVLSDEWSTEAVHPTSPLEPFVAAAERYRKILWEEVLGRFDDPLLPPNPRSRRLKETDDWVAYEVVLDVVPELFAWGILMLPRDELPDQPRPVVVVQHGRNGLPEQVMNGGYNGIADKLLRRGFVVFAPHNMYRGEDEYRWLDRKANAIGKSLFSLLILQHDQITRWLATLPQVDGDRIAFYGNSYGGESAVRIPTVLTRYALSICASDFNDWTRKVTSTHARYSFMRTVEWEMPYFNMGNTFSYAELAWLMVPRPFMVERGHHDRVAPDSWVASEYARVRLVYDQLGIGDRTAITFFQGGHTMRGEETVQFLERHLHWPPSTAAR